MISDPEIQNDDEATTHYVHMDIRSREALERYERMDDVDAWYELWEGAPRMFISDRIPYETDDLYMTPSDSQVSQWLLSEELEVHLPQVREVILLDAYLAVPEDIGFKWVEPYLGGITIDSKICVIDAMRDICVKKYGDWIKGHFYKYDPNLQWSMQVGDLSFDDDYYEYNDNQDDYW